MKEWFKRLSLPLFVALRWMFCYSNHYNSTRSPFNCSVTTNKQVLGLFVITRARASSNIHSQSIGFNIDLLVLPLQLTELFPQDFTLVSLQFFCVLMVQVLIFDIEKLVLNVLVNFVLSSLVQQSLHGSCLVHW